MAQADAYHSNIIPFPHPHAIGQEPDATIEHVMWELVEIALCIEDRGHDALVQKIGSQVDALGQMLNRARSLRNAREVGNA